MKQGKPVREIDIENFLELVFSDYFIERLSLIKRDPEGKGPGVFGKINYLERGHIIKALSRSYRALYKKLSQETSEQIDVVKFSSDTMPSYLPDGGCDESSSKIRDTQINDQNKSLRKELARNLLCPK